MHLTESSTSPGVKLQQLETPSESHLKAAPCSALQAKSLYGHYVDIQLTLSFMCWLFEAMNNHIVRQQLLNTMSGQPHGVWTICMVLRMCSMHSEGFTGRAVVS